MLLCVFREVRVLCEARNYKNSKRASFITFNLYLFRDWSPIYSEYGERVLLLHDLTEITGHIEENRNKQ